MRRGTSRATLPLRSSQIGRPVIHEAALHMRFGGMTVMRRQLLHLIHTAELHHVTVQVLPFTAERPVRL
ncbi:Scr1 family TA system antitoxin-like transcriptional regulator [Streptomyces sp. NPDC020747]|uniref:Scr1 family TA system antitoxin-like transcriptional regulator n=1 Tax=Streptomyces sp. NPDC020747 TaxID=3365086 RepID=UPI00378FD7DC